MLFAQRMKGQPRIFGLRGGDGQVHLVLQEQGIERLAPADMQAQVQPCLQQRSQPGLPGLPPLAWIKARGQTPSRSPAAKADRQTSRS